MVLSTRLSAIFGANNGIIQNISLQYKKERILKILLTIGYFLVAYNFLTLFFHQPQGYIIDIYSALPLSFFLSLIICFTLGSSIIFLSQGITRKLGVVLLVFTYSAVLLIPYMLGYYSMGRADDMTYIGEYLQISKSGYIAGWDIYPASHIIGATLSIGAGLAPHLVSFVIPFIFSFLFLGGLFLCCHLFLKDQVLTNIAISSSFIFYLGPYNFLNVPHALFFSIMPLYIFMLLRFIKYHNFSNILMIFPLTFLIPFTHPFIVLFLISILLAIIVVKRYLKLYVNLDYQRVTSPLIIVIIGFLSWLMFCAQLTRTFSRIYQSYLLKTTDPVYLESADKPVFYETTDKLFRINIDIFKFMKLIFVYYGRYTIPILVIVIAVIILYFKRDRISQVLKNQMVFWVFFYIVFLCVELILFFNPFISHQPDRLTNLNFTVFAQVPLLVLSIYVIFFKPESSNRKIVFLLLMLSSIWSLSLFGAFNSPNTFKANSALSHNEVYGMHWFYETKTTEISLSPLSQIDRFNDLFSENRKDISFSLPDHFGYVNDSSTFSEIYLETGIQESYIILLTVDEYRYQKVPGYMEVGRYNAEDFYRFRNDDSVNKIFDDLNIEIYKGKFLI